MKSARYYRIILFKKPVKKFILYSSKILLTLCIGYGMDFLIQPLVKKTGKKNPYYTPVKLCIGYGMDFFLIRTNIKHEETPPQSGEEI